MEPLTISTEGFPIQYEIQLASTMVRRQEQYSSVRRSNSICKGVASSDFIISFINHRCNQIQVFVSKWVSCNMGVFFTGNQMQMLQLIRLYFNGIIVIICVKLVEMMFHQKMEGLKSNGYSFLRPLGSGQYAVVYEAINERDGSTVAVKTLPRKLLQFNSKLEELVGTEIRVMRAISERGNENVVRFIDRFMSDKSLFIVMEYCNGGDLQRQLQQKKVFTEQKATTYLKQILNGFKGLHEVKAMHRDFKLPNLLLHQGVCKIADMGFAKQLGKGSVTMTFCGTSQNMAPEILAEKPYGMEADIWSVGVVYYQMLYGKYPYQDKFIHRDEQMLELIKKTVFDFSGIKISTNARNFIERCLTIDPRDRISWSQIYEHPLIKEVDKMIYELSSLRVSANKDFYKKGVEVNKDYIYVERNKEKKKEEQNISAMTVVKVEEIIQSQIQKKIEKAERKKLEDVAAKKYEQTYLKHRNNIMFVFKYVTPHINSLIGIVANHAITLFILSKKAYLEMARLSRFIDQRKNFLNSNPYFLEFTQTPAYKELSNRIKSDAEIIKSQVQAYWEDIEECNQQVQQQFNIETIRNPNWDDFVEEIMRSYQFQLINGMEYTNKAVTKKGLIEVIEALNYYRNNFHSIEVEQFEKKISGLDYKAAEKDINQRLAESLK